MQCVNTTIEKKILMIINVYQIFSTINNRRYLSQTSVSGSQLQFEHHVAV